MECNCLFVQNLKRSPRIVYSGWRDIISKIRLAALGMLNSPCFVKVSFSKHLRQIIRYSLLCLNDFFLPNLDFASVLKYFASVLKYSDAVE